jgi:hypothetical protein
MSFPTSEPQQFYVSTPTTIRSAIVPQAYLITATSDNQWVNLTIEPQLVSGANLTVSSFILTPLGGSGPALAGTAYVPKRAISYAYIINTAPATNGLGSIALDTAGNITIFGAFTAASGASYIPTPNAISVRYPVF